MIKVLNEEPIALATIKDIDVVSYGVPDNMEYAWIYKNPTQREMGDLLTIAEEFRLLVKDNDYYICSAYQFVHREMVKLLFQFTHTREYEHFVMSKHFIRVGESSRNKELRAYKRLQAVYDDMVKIGLIDKYTIVEGFSFDGDKIVNVFKKINMCSDEDITDC